MEITSKTTALLEPGDIRQAIAEWVSKYQGGEYTFDPSTVVFFDRHDNAIEGTVTAKIETSS